MNVSDMQIPDEDDRVAAQPPPHDQNEQQDRERANVNDDSQFANKITKERIWALNSPLRQQTARL